MNDAYQLILPHDTVWAIYEPAARQLWQMVGQMDMATHLEEFARRGPAPAARYFASFADPSAKGSDDDGAVRVRVGDESEHAGKPFQMEGSVAVIPVSGVLTKAGTSLNRSGSMVYIGRMVDLAARDKDVSAIVLRADSPGGSVSGTQALADRVKAAAGIKPVIAVIEDLCASAMYWVVSGATRIVANPTALVGSIGTYMAIADHSRAAANAGVQVHVLSTGAHKGAGTPGSPITDAQLAAWQQMIDATNQHFLDAVSQNRGIAPEALGPIADGRVHLADAALSMGLIDGLGSYETTLADLATTAKENSMKFIDRFKAARAGAALSQETSETAEAIAAAADTEIEAQAGLHAAELAASKKQLADREATLAAKDAEISRLRAQADADAQAALDAQAEAEAEANDAAIEALVADFKLTPAAAEQATALRAAAPEAFDAVFADMKPLAAAAGTSARKTPGARGATRPAADVAAALTGGQTAADQLGAIADAKIKASPRTPYHVAFSEACAENPELAAAHVSGS